MTVAERIYQAVKPMPEPLALEVLDFVEYLTLKREGQGWTALQESSLKHVWGNEDDEIWNGFGRQ